MKNRLTILVDWDDVINDLMPKALELLNESHGTNYTLESFPEFNFSKYLPEADSNALHAMFLSEELWNVLRPNQDAPETLKRMIADGHEVFLVTATHWKNVAYKMDWLAKYFPFIQWEQVIVTSRKDKVRGDWLIDDNPLNIKNHPYGRVCMDKPWNRSLNDDVYDIIRVKNLREAYEAILVRENQEIELSQRE